MKTYKVDEILNSKEFSSFYNEACDFCEYIDYKSKISTNSFLKELRFKLLRLYNKAIELQWVDLQSNISYDDMLDDKEFEKTLSLISSRLDNNRYYWHIYDSSNNEDIEPVCGDLVDDLADIYKDLKFSIMTYNLDKEDCIENALWQFKSDFNSHWDNHCINALSAIHYLLKKE